MRAWGDWSPGLRAVVAVAATTLFMVLVSWATLVGTDEVFTGPGPSPGPASTATESCIPLPVRTEPDGSTTVLYPDDHAERDYCDPPAPGLDDYRDIVEQNPPPLWVKVLVWVFLTTLLLAVAAGLLWLLVAVAREVMARRGDVERPEVAFTVLDEPARLAESMTGDADEQDAVLRDGEPRNAIVAAWHRFEVQGEQAGVARRPSETSSEFAIRVLDLAAADPAPVSRLAELYREARFSEHPITEEHRAEALSALAAIRRSLEVRT
jgi:hypothetical protein